MTTLDAGICFIIISAKILYYFNEGIIYYLQHICSGWKRGRERKASQEGNPELAYKLRSTLWIKGDALMQMMMKNKIEDKESVSKVEEWERAYVASRLIG